MHETGALLVDIKYDDYEKTEPFKKLLPERRIIDWSNHATRPKNFDGIHYAIGWKPDAGLFARLPDLKVMFSVGAGVDHMISDKTLPDLPLVRFVDASLTNRMSEWICLQCLLHLRQHLTYRQQQARHIWRDHPQPDAEQVRVGIMGMGVLGQDAASKLKMLGFQVNGWSRSKKTIPGVTCFDGEALNEFLTTTDILIGLLPHTPQTDRIFNTSVFTKLPRQTPIGGPVFINAGRGKCQNEADIANALNEGLLGGASLDVFENEPLDANSPLWDLDNVILTPHISAVSDANALARHIIGQINRFENGKPLEHLVDRSAGY